MSEEEIKEYLKRVDELELKLTDEDKDTYQWLLFGYNECARLLNEKEQENKKLKAKLEMYENGVYYSSENDKLKEVIEEVRELIPKQLLSNVNITKYTDEMCLRDILQILDKAKENK